MEHAENVPAQLALSVLADTLLGEGKPVALVVDDRYLELGVGGRVEEDERLHRDSLCGSGMKARVSTLKSVWSGQVAPEPTAIARVLLEDLVSRLDRLACSGPEQSDELSAVCTSRHANSDTPAPTDRRDGRLFSPS